uniref:Uncharacterized protein n=1 Tax=Steinernema glaseri TaxID=37863 RepID=A0A1I7ZI03_9BILA
MVRSLGQLTRSSMGPSFTHLHKPIGKIQYRVSSIPDIIIPGVIPRTMRSRTLEGFLWFPFRSFPSLQTLKTTPNQGGGALWKKPTPRRTRDTLFGGML